MKRMLLKRTQKAQTKIRNNQTNLKKGKVMGEKKLTLGMKKLGKTKSKISIGVRRINLLRKAKIDNSNLCFMKIKRMDNNVEISI